MRVTKGSTDVYKMYKGENLFCDVQELDSWIIDTTSSSQNRNSLQGKNKLIKNGSNSLTLSGENTYGGATIVNQGSLFLEKIYWETPNLIYPPDTAKATFESVAISSDGMIQTAVTNGSNSNNKYIWRSIDGGKNWNYVAGTNISTDGYGWVKVRMSDNGQKQFAARNNGGIYRSDNAGSLWGKLNTPFNFVYSGESPPRGQLLVSSDGGILLVSANSDINVNYLEIYKSTNAGYTWSKLQSIAPTDVTGMAMSSNGQYITYVDSKGVFTSSNGGSSFIKRVSFAEFVYSALSMSSDGRIQTRVERSDIYVSTDWGVNWVAKNKINGLAVYSCSMSGDGQKQITNASNSYISYDSGATWDMLFAPPKDERNVSIAKDGTRASYIIAGNIVATQNLNNNLPIIKDTTDVILMPGTSLGTPSFITSIIEIGSLSGSGRIYLATPILSIGKSNKITTYSGSIGGMSKSLVKVGNGTLILTSFSDYTGGTTVNSGRLKLGNGTNTGIIRGPLTINSNGIVETIGKDSFGFTPNVGVSNLFMNGGQYIHSSSSNPNQNITLANIGIYIRDGAIISCESSGGLHFLDATCTVGTNPLSTKTCYIKATSGSINLRSSQITIFYVGGSGSVGLDKHLVVSAPITGSGGIKKQYEGTMVLSGNDTYTGTTDIDEGKLIVSKGHINPQYTATATFQNGGWQFPIATLSVSFSSPPNSGDTIRFFPGATVQSMSSITLIGAPGKYAAYNSATSTLTIA